MGLELAGALDGGEAVGEQINGAALSCYDNKDNQEIWRLLRTQVNAVRTRFSQRKEEQRDDEDIRQASDFGSFFCSMRISLHFFP